MMRLLTIAVVMVLVAASVTACGRNGAPEAPPGTTYPAQYPHQ